MTLTPISFTDQPLAHAQFGPQLHCVPQVQTFELAAFWQPQVQVAPGQLLQVQRTSLELFMSCLLQVELVWVTQGQSRWPTQFQLE